MMRVHLFYLILIIFAVSGTIAVAPRQFVEWRRPSTVPNTGVYFRLLLGTQCKVCRFFATLGLLMSALTCEFPWKTISTHHRKCQIQLSYSLRRFMFCIFYYFWRGWIYKKYYNWLGTNYKYIFKSNYILKVKISTYLYLFKIHFCPMSTTYLKGQNTYIILGWKKYQF